MVCSPRLGFGCWFSSLGLFKDSGSLSRKPFWGAADSVFAEPEGSDNHM